MILFTFFFIKQGWCIDLQHLALSHKCYFPLHIRLQAIRSTRLVLELVQMLQWLCIMFYYVTLWQWQGMTWTQHDTEWRCNFDIKLRTFTLKIFHTHFSDIFRFFNKVLVCKYTLYLEVLIFLATSYARPILGVLWF